MSAHTAGPWHVGRKSGFCVFADETMVARCSEEDGMPIPEAKANALRIVACVNACEGISTADLESNRHPGAAESERDALRAQNEMLRESLVHIARITAPQSDMGGFFGDGSDMAPREIYTRWLAQDTGLCNIARAALDKAQS